MLPVVNGKLLFDCEEEDLQVLVDNPDYRENEYLDYKLNFAFLEYSKGDKKREEHLAEFRSDVCSFANAGGGYIVYGISDNHGMAAKIIGVDIPEGNTDRFELERKNNLNLIMPKMPLVRFKFIHLSNDKYVVIIYVEADYFAPYIHIEDQKDYRIYKRNGNGKKSMNYVELKNMFNKSMSIEKEVQLYRENRISYYKEMQKEEDVTCSPFLLLHIIPDTFMDSYYNKNLFIIEKQERISFYKIFSEIGCSSWSIPNVDGLRFYIYNSNVECQVGNNGICELYFPLYESISFGRSEKYPNGYFPSEYVWEKLKPVVENYISSMKNILHSNRVFVCVSIIGCKDVATEDSWGVVHSGKIDRNNVICLPVVFDNILDEENVYLAIKQFQIEYYLALGMKNSKELKELIKEVYQIEIN